MPRPRKKYRPRPVGYLLTPNQITELVLPAHIAVSHLTTGLFSASNWHDLAMFCDVIQLLANQDGYIDQRDLAAKCCKALLSMRERRRRVNRWGCNAEELALLRQAINPLDAYLRRQQQHRVIAVLQQLDKAMAAAEAADRENPVIPPAFYPAAASGQRP